MSIIKAIEKAYQKAESRNWNRIYFAIDVHDTIVKSSYSSGELEFINESAKHAMRLLSERPEVVTILWSSMYEYDFNLNVKSFFESEGIIFDFINENPMEQSNSYADFGKKFYFSVLLDDKAGFDPDVDWDRIIQFYAMKDNPNVSGRNV